MTGESAVEFHVPILAGLRDLRLRFSIGIRDGAEAKDRLVAFRVRVDGWQDVEPRRLAGPVGAGRGAAAASGRQYPPADLCDRWAGEQKFAWAAWGEPALEGAETRELEREEKCVGCASAD